MKFIKSLMFAGCFCISTVWANMNNEGLFVELISEVGGTLYGVGLMVGGGMGYKYNSSNDNYFGYFQGDFDFSVLALVAGVGSDEIGNISGVVNVEYGYEFRRESSFSYGVSVSPLVPMFTWDRSLDNTFNKSGEDNSSSENNNQFKTRFVSFIGVFGNIKINDSFLIFQLKERA